MAMSRNSKNSKITSNNKSQLKLDKTMDECEKLRQKLEDCVNFSEFNLTCVVDESDLEEGEEYTENKTIAECENLNKGSKTVLTLVSLT